MFKETIQRFFHLEDIQAYRNDLLLWEQKQHPYQTNQTNSSADTEGRREIIINNMEAAINLRNRAIIIALGFGSVATTTVCAWLIYLANN